MNSQIGLNDLANHIEDSESDVVTLVRRQTVYSEIVISKNKLKQIQNAFADDDYDLLDELKNEMVTDDVMKDFGDEEESWMVFHGDVQDCTDDMISWTNKEWSHFGSLKV